MISNFYIAQTRIINGQTWYVEKFETSPKMSTYLIAVTVTDFDFVEKFTSDGVQVITVINIVIPLRGILMVVERVKMATALWRAIYFRHRSALTTRCFIPPKLY